ncbi:MAG: histidinol-phosphate aminotransferase family protein [Caldilineaceae bacterium]|nr:histidinol-phosphate aminotransferase family protein [Caldilineaceae bacterium]
MPKMEIHGTPDYAELEALGLAPSDVVYFSSNINPYGPPPAVVEALAARVVPGQIALYPDRLSRRLSRRLAAYHDVPSDAILVGNGTADLMWLLAIGLATARKIVVLGPTFSEYENVASLMNAECVVVEHPGWVRRGEEFVQAERGLADVADAIAHARPDLVFVCNPNNPTGRYLTPAELLTLHAAAPEATWVVDEAYAEFAAQPWSATQWIEDGRWIVLRSMTKDFSLGGLRLGYLVAAPDQVAKLQKIQPPWNVNTFAQVAGEAAMDCLDWRLQTTSQLRAHVATLAVTLAGHGLRPEPSAVNFFLLPLARSATEIRAGLLKQGLVVRDCTSFGLPNHIRIAVQQPHENAKLATALIAAAQIPTA